MRAYFPLEKGLLDTIRRSREPGYQFDFETQGEHLGMNIKKYLIEAHGGKVWMESEGLGKGTTVRFTVGIAN
ncbi:MAG: sensor histidine kinase [Desulfobacteraceae bacterium]|nr:MAG: sensor histidine kinase [Desulfobacteraceae bacterium]